MSFLSRISDEQDQVLVIGAKLRCRLVWRARDEKRCDAERGDARHAISERHEKPKIKKVIETRRA
jgi:hypothetical protein